MCGGDDHLARKRPVFSEACRGLRTVGRSYLVSFIHSVCIVESHFRSCLSLESHPWKRVGGRLIRADSHQSSDSSVEMSDELTSTFASIQEFMAKVSRRLDQIESSRQDHHPIGINTNDTVPHVPQTAQVFPLGTSHGIPFHLSDHCETVPLPTVTVPLPLLLLLMMLDWPSRRPSADIDVSRRELEATRQRPNESISSFVNHWRAKDLKSLLHAAFNVKEAIARGLWTYTATSPDNKGKKSFGSSSRFGEVGDISYQHQRPAHHSSYRPPIVRVHFSHPQYQYQPVYVHEPYIAQTSMQPRPPHPRATTHPPPRPYA
ncbi:hypothetical protein CK203_069070 [Vitis vinifera]|uniref:Uncharacterized protein n=1 Tax=Vitis vinifera TaxID=29760 RepID=A0A438F225_VITVI|nr:hypothetical protein CK203_069070 [Vitis vinifera]